MKSIVERFKSFFKSKIPEGESIFLDVPSTQYPKKYSEGLFIYTDLDARTSSSLDYHTERGGDPEVFWAAINSGLLKNNTRL
jgi:hypothetical protein